MPTNPDQMKLYLSRFRSALRDSLDANPGVADEDRGEPKRWIKALGKSREDVEQRVVFWLGVDPDDVHFL